MSVDFYPTMQHAVNAVLAKNNPRNLMFNVFDLNKEDTVKVLQGVGEDPGPDLAGVLSDYIMGGEACLFGVYIVRKEDDGLHETMIGAVLAHDRTHRCYAFVGSE